MFTLDANVATPVTERVEDAVKAPAEVNDVWNIDGILLKYPNAKAIVYNRWGNVVWRSTGSYGRSSTGRNIWYGQQEGSQELVPDGVYYYLLELEDGFGTTKTGFIEIMRQ